MYGAVAIGTRSWASRCYYCHNGNWSGVAAKSRPKEVAFPRLRLFPRAESRSTALNHSLNHLSGVEPEPTSGAEFQV